MKDTECMKINTFLLAATILLTGCASTSKSDISPEASLQEVIQKQQHDFENLTTSHEVSSFIRKYQNNDKSNLIEAAKSKRIIFLEEEKVAKEKNAIKTKKLLEDLANLSNKQEKKIVKSNQERDRLFLAQEKDRIVQDEAREKDRIARDEARKLKVSLYKDQMETNKNRWDNRFNASYKVGDSVCTYDNRIAFVEQSSSENIKVLIKGKLESNYSAGYFFGNQSEYEYENDFKFQPQDNLTWLSKNRIGHCGFYL